MIDYIIAYMITIIFLAFTMLIITTHFYFKNKQLNKQLDFLEDEIESTLEEEKSKKKPNWFSEQDALNQGWIEALQYSLRQVRFVRLLKLKEINNVNKKS